jgi:hypothetical protein
MGPPLRATTIVTPMTAALLAVILIVIVPMRAGAQQDLGHKTLGTIGLQAGSQSNAGVYLVDQIFRYRATKLKDRHGDEVPVGLDLDVLAGALGASGTIELPRRHTFLTIAVSLPLARSTTTTTRPEASIDRFGLGDLFVQPVKLGWQARRLHVVTSYAFYVPTGRFEPYEKRGIGRGHWTHQPSLGGTVFLDDGQTWNLSALASYDINLKKRNIDIRRGNTIAIQGGLGTTILRILDVGIAAHALWQVTDDTGADLPPAVIGARDRSYGLGPEVDLTIPSFRIRITTRYEHDVGVASRPSGELFLLGFSTVVWKPSPRDGAR